MFLVSEGLGAASKAFFFLIEKASAGGRLQSEGTAGVPLDPLQTHSCLSLSVSESKSPTQVLLSSLCSGENESRGSGNGTSQWEAWRIAWKSDLPLGGKFT